MTTITQYLPYLLIGIGVGYLVSLGTTGGPTLLDHRKEDIKIKKEWYKRLANKNK